MRVGLGTGTTSTMFIRALAERVAAGLKIRCVASSDASHNLGLQLGMDVTTLDQLPELDIYIDGADEVGARPRPDQRWRRRAAAREDRRQRRQTLPRRRRFLQDRPSSRPLSPARRSRQDGLADRSAQTRIPRPPPRATPRQRRRRPLPHRRGQLHPRLRLPARSPTPKTPPPPSAPSSESSSTASSSTWLRSPWSPTKTASQRGHGPRVPRPRKSKSRMFHPHHLLGYRRRPAHQRLGPRTARTRPHPPRRRPRSLRGASRPRQLLLGARPHLRRRLLLPDRPQAQPASSSSPSIPSGPRSAPSRRSSTPSASTCSQSSSNPAAIVSPPSTTSRASSTNIASTPSNSALCFDYFICSGYVHEMKPNPGHLQSAPSTSPALPRDTALFIDDKQENCEAAAALGIQTIVFQSPAQLSKALCGLRHQPSITSATKGIHNGTRNDRPRQDGRLHGGASAPRRPQGCRLRLQRGSRRQAHRLGLRRRLPPSKTSSKNSPPPAPSGSWSPPATPSTRPSPSSSPSCRTATSSSTAATPTTRTPSAATPPPTPKASSTSTAAPPAAVWGLKEGYSMMIGGDKEPSTTSTPSSRRSLPLPTEGWGHVGPSGAGHFVKMVHNGIEYGMMQAYAEGFSIMKAKKALGTRSRADLPASGRTAPSSAPGCSISPPTPSKRTPHSTVSKPMSPTPAKAAGPSSRPSTSTSPPPSSPSRLIRRLRSREENNFTDRMLSIMRNEFGGHAVKKS